MAGMDDAAAAPRVVSDVDASALGVPGADDGSPYQEPTDYNELKKVKSAFI